MNILIIGIGALGGLIAARLTAGGTSVSFATRDAESAARLKVSGLRVIGVGGGLTVEARRVASLDAYACSDSFDLIVLATKLTTPSRLLQDYWVCSNRVARCYRSRMEACR